MAGEHRRRRHLDWLRGLAVLIMIEAHLLDSWTRAGDRGTGPFAWAMLLGGIGAPLFLFLAGAAVSLSAGSKARRSGDAAAASRAVIRRGLEIFALAFLFRIQAWVLGMGPAWTLLKVDILNIMGPSIVLAALLWRCGTGARARALLFGAGCAAAALATPFVRAAAPLSALPDPLEAYLRPIPQLTNFAFFPSVGFVLAGALVGVLLDRAYDAAAETSIHLRAGVAGALLALGAYALSHLPSPYPASEFWTSSPAFFSVRIGVLVCLTAVAFAWERRTFARERWRSTGGWSPLQQLGRTSLFIYWIHVELVYGLVSLPLHKALSFPQACGALAGFVVLMLGLSILKERAAEWWRGRRARPAFRAVA